MAGDALAQLREVLLHQLGVAGEVGDAELEEPVAALEDLHPVELHPIAGTEARLEAGDALGRPLQRRKAALQQLDPGRGLLHLTDHAQEVGREPARLRAARRIDVGRDQHPVFEPVGGGHVALRAIVGMQPAALERAHLRGKDRARPRMLVGPLMHDVVGTPIGRRFLLRRATVGCRATEQDQCQNQRRARDSRCFHHIPPSEPIPRGTPARAPRFQGAACLQMTRRLASPDHDGTGRRR